MYLAGFSHSLNTYSSCYDRSPFFTHPFLPMFYRSIVLPSLPCSVPGKLTPAWSGCLGLLASIWVWLMGGITSQPKGPRGKMGQCFLSVSFPHEPHFWPWTCASRITDSVGWPDALQFPPPLGDTRDTVVSPVPSALAWQWLPTFAGPWVSHNPLFIPVIVPSLLWRVPSLNCLYLNHLGYQLLTLL